MVQQRHNMLHDQRWQVSHAVDLSFLQSGNCRRCATPAAANCTVPPVHGVAQREVVLRAAAIMQ
jgi:hypothetical protein